MSKRVGNKTHSYQLILSKWFGPKKKQRRSGSHWTGVETKCIVIGQKKKKKKKKSTHATYIFTESQLMALTLWRHTIIWAGELQLPYIVSPLTDCSQLTAVSWGRTSQVHPIAPDGLWPRSWEISVHIRTLGNLWSLCITKMRRRRLGWTLPSEVSSLSRSSSWLVFKLCCITQVT